MTVNEPLLLTNHTYLKNNLFVLCKKVWSQLTNMTSELTQSKVNVHNSFLFQVKKKMHTGLQFRSEKTAKVLCITLVVKN